MKRVLTFCLILLSFGCHKDPAPPPPVPMPTPCPISQFIDVSGGRTVISILTYDQTGRLIQTNDGSSQRIINYTPDSTVVSSSTNGVFNGRSVIINNKDGLAVNIHYIADVQGTLWSNITYQYDGQQLVKSTYTDFAGYNVVTTYAWSGGNMVSISGSGVTQNLEYYTDQPRQQGDYQYFLQFIQGYETIRSKNLVKTQSGLNITYDFKPNGKISSAKATPPGGATVALKYDYPCN
ncbi:MAG: hypothetical protein JST68_27525 [Bacteroidetes bacterium]|nr:hypothetical protein [Bacteroidota bacterium]